MTKFTIEVEIDIYAETPAEALKKFRDYSVKAIEYVEAVPPELKEVTPHKPFGALTGKEHTKEELGWKGHVTIKIAD